MLSGAPSPGPSQQPPLLLLGKANSSGHEVSRSLLSFLKFRFADSELMSVLSHLWLSWFSVPSVSFVHILLMAEGYVFLLLDEILS